MPATFMGLTSASREVLGLVREVVFDQFFGPDFNSDLLPTDSENTCEVGSCFKAGDGRVNENPQLSVIHTVFMREHNRVAEKLQQLNQGWSDEKIFQEAKKFVTAEYQHIVYNEWLPSIIGK